MIGACEAGFEHDKSFSSEKRNGYILAVISISVVTAPLAPFHDHINSTTIALALLLAVLFVATGFGSKPALLAAVLGVISFNFFFLPPVGTLTIADPQNWIALGAFLVTAVTAGQLSSRAKQRAIEAETARVEIERLYNELRDAFERASHAEALRQSEQLKSALLDAVTHDLRTPLTSIKASVTTLLGEMKDSEPIEIDPEGRQELLEVIDEETDRLNHFIEGLVELARIEAGQMQLRRRWVVIDEIINSALKRAEPLTRQHKINLIIETELPAIRIDGRAIAELIYSLIDNATKYSPADSQISLIANREGMDMIRVIVEDQGPGIPSELRSAVFTKFFRGTTEPSKNARRAAGIGMGLAIAHGIVDAHGGRIWIESGDAGIGTRVIFTLPIGDDETIPTSKE